MLAECASRKVGTSGAGRGAGAPGLQDTLLKARELQVVLPGDAHCTLETPPDPIGQFLEDHT